MADKIRWGILGTGYIAKKFAEALSYLPDAILTAVGSRTRESAQAFAAEFQVPRAYASYRALVEDPEVDVVYVATVNTLHRENCLMALQAGKPVLCEKPFMVNASEAKEVIALAREKRLFLMEALWTRFVPCFQQARQRWEAGEIGDLRVVTAEFGFVCDPTPPNPLYDLSLAGGSLLDIGAYPITMAHIVFGEPDTIASLAHVGGSGVDEQTGMLFGYRGGQIGVGYSSFQVDSPKVATIVGTRGHIRIHSPFYCPSEYTLSLTGKDPQAFQVPYLGNGWNYEALEVMNCLRSGKLESDLAPLNDSIGLVRTMDRIRAQIGLIYPGEA